MSRRSFPGRRNRLLAWAAIGTGMVAAALMIGSPASEASTSTMLVASRPVAAGTVLSSADIVAVPAPGGLSAGGVEREATAVEGRRTRAVLHQGDLVTSAALEPADAVAPLAPGERAVPVPVSTAGGSAAMLHPGARVDVMASRGDGPLSTTAVVVWNAQVLDVPVASADGYVAEDAAVMIRVTSSQALRITAALNYARDVRMVVRPDDERGTRPPRGVRSP